MGNALDDVDQPLDAITLDLFGKLVGHRSRLRARARRIDERERAVVSDLLDCSERFAEVLFRLAREAHDQVGREGEVGDRGAHLVHEPQIPLACVGPAHSLQDAR